MNTVCRSLLVLLLSLIISTPVLEAITYVDAGATGANTGTSWEDAYTDLQTALLNTESSTLWVARGVYKPTSGADRTASFTPPSGITIYAGFEGGETSVDQRNPDPATNGCILSGDIGIEGDASDNSYHVVSIIDINSNIRIEGFTITGGNANGSGANEDRGGGMICATNRSFVNLSSMRFEGNQASYGGGALYVTLTTVRFNTSQFLANRAGSRGGAIYFEATGRVQMFNSAFVGNTANAGGAVYAFGENGYDNEFTEGEFWIYSCTFTANAATADGGAISNFGGASTRLVRAIAWNNSSPSDPDVDPPLTNQSVDNFIGVNPQFRFLPDSGDGDWFTLEDNFYGDLRLHESSTLIDTLGTLFVGTDYTDLDNDLSREDSLPFDLTFRPRTNNTMEPGAYEFYEPIIHVDPSVAKPGDGTSWEKAYADLADALEYTREGDQLWVAEGTYTPGDSREDSFVVNPGVSLFGGFPAGGGLRGFEARNYNPLTNNTVLSGDLNGDDAPGFANRDDNAYHVVTFANDFGKPWIDGFTIRGGQANGTGSLGNGGGVYSTPSNADPLLSHVIITDNFAASEGGGVSSGAPVTIVNSQVRNNAADTGGGLSLTNQFFELTNTLVAENSATTRGGGIYTINGSVRLSNVTIAANTAPNGSAMLGEISSEANVSNSIIWGNTGSGSAIQDVAFLSLSSNYISQDEPGAEDPQLLAPTYELAAGSPAIDAGNNIKRGRDAADTDQDGNFQEEIPTDGFGFWRLEGAFVDIGAYEYQRPLSGLDNTLLQESWEVGLGDGAVTDFLPQPWVHSEPDLNVIWRPGPSAQGKRFNQTTPLPAPAHGQHVLYLSATDATVARVTETPLEADALYELTAAIGADELVDSSGWSIELWVDANEDGAFNPGTDAQLASLDAESAGSINPAEGLWAPNRLSYVYDSAQHAALLGKPIIVVLANRISDMTAYFDNVSFAKTIEAALASTSPEAKSVDNGLSPVIAMTFGESINTATINNDSLIVTGSVSGRINGDIDFTLNGIEFDPDAPLAPGETITVSFTDAARSGSNVSLAANRFTFQTELAEEVDTAARMNHRRPDSLIGNFVDTTNGDFRPSYSLIDVQGIRSLSFPIAYHSLFTQTTGELGYGWSHAYEVCLTGDPNGEIILRWDNTRRNTFHYRGPGTPYFSDEPSMVDHQLVRQDDGSWLLSTPSDLRYEFDAGGRLNRVGNAVFQWLQIHYEQGRLARVEEPVSEKSLYLEYNDKGRIVSVRDDILREVQLRYDDPGRLVSTTDPLLFGETTIGEQIESPIPVTAGSVETYVMDVADIGTVGHLKIEPGIFTSNIDMTGLRLTLVSPSGRSVVIHDREGGSFDFSGRVITELDGELLEGEWTLEMDYSAGSNTISLLDWQMVYTGSSNAIHYHYPEAPAPAFARITRATDVLGDQLYANSYDSRGRVLTQDDGVSTNQVARITYSEDAHERTTVYSDRLGNDFTLVHTPAGFLTKLVDPLGAVTSYELNAFGDRTAMTNALGWTWYFQYDEFGNLIQMEDPYRRVRTFEYDAQGNVIDINGGKTQLSYDGLNNAISLKHPTNHTRENAYDPTSQISSARDFRFDDNDESLSETTFVLWNGSIGRERTMELPDGGTIVTRYDAIGRVISMTNADNQTTTTRYTQTGQVASTTDPLGNVSSFAYDHRDRLIQQIDKNGVRTGFAYDGNNNTTGRTSFLNEEPLTTEIFYDGEDRPTGSIDPGGRSNWRAYNPLGNVSRVTDGEGRTTYIRYNLLGGEIERREGSGGLLLRTDYDRLGLVIREIDGDGFRTDFSYTDLGTPLTATTQDKIMAGAFTSNSGEVPLSGPGGSRSIRSTYGVAQMRNPADVRTSFNFDANGRVEEAITYVGGDNLSTRWAYDDRGLMVKETKPSGKSLDFDYDELGRLKTIDASDGSSGRHYTYDNKGNLLTASKTASESGAILTDSTIEQRYDELDRLTFYRDTDGNVVRFQYDDSGNLSLIVYPDNKTVAYTYNQAGQLATVTDWAGRVTSYTYNKIGRVSRIEFPNGSSRELHYRNSGSVSRRYDREPDGSIIVGYEYVRRLPTELAGEHALHDETPYLPGDVTMTYDPHDRIQTYNGEAVSVDDDGYMTHPPSSLGLGVLEFNVHGNLVSEGGNSFSYDPGDRLVGWSHEEESVDFVVHPGGGLGQTLVKINDDGTRTNYVYGIGLIYEETEGETRTFHYDTRGSTAALSDDSGSTVGRISYGPYGEIANRSGDTDTIFLYNGLYGIITAPNGLLNMRFRWYVPELKRFASADAHRGNIFSADSMNRYVFANNNPIARIDPNGELAFLAPLVGGAVGAVVGATTTLVVDYLDDGEINTPWQEYAGAAIGGAVTGAILTVNPGLAFSSGAAGAFADSLFVGLTDPDQDLTLGGLATDTVIGGTLGKVVPGARKGAGKLKSSVFGAGKKTINQAKRRGVRGWGQLLKRELDDEIRFASKELVVSLGVQFAVSGARDSLARSGGSGLNDPGGGVGDGAGGGGGLPPGNASVHLRSINEPQEGITGIYGAHLHWSFYVEALQRAGKPVPSHPNQTLDNF